MLTQYEARKLQATMRRELQGEPAALWKCVAGLLVVMIMAIVGALDVTGREVPATASTAPSLHHAVH